MNLRKEVVNRLILAKSLLPETLGHASVFSVARQVLSAHDAAELVFAAIADQQNKLPAKAEVPSMMKCLELIVTVSEKHAGYFTQLNDARNGLKHAGNLPNTQQWSAVAVDVAEKLSALCSATLGATLEEIDELELLSNPTVKQSLAEAKTYSGTGEFRRALEVTAKALFWSLDGHPNVWEVQVGSVKAEDALKLSAYGIPAGDFLRLQEFLPEYSEFPAGTPKIQWNQSRFGHPGNWHHESVDFCIRTCLSIALRIQDAPTIPLALEFQYAYQYKVTAKHDQVEVWEDLIEGNLSTSGARPFKFHVRYLRKGESLIVPFTDSLVTYDQASAGEEIRRVRIAEVEPYGAISNALGIRPERARFVNLADVELTCVPNPLLRELSGTELSEVPWEPAPTLGPLEMESVPIEDGPDNDLSEDEN